MKKWLDTDTKKGNLLFILALIGYASIYYITRKKFSFLYGMPGIFFLLAVIYWFFGTSQQKLRSGFIIALIGIVAIWIFFLLMELLVK